LINSVNDCNPRVDWKLYISSMGLEMPPLVNFCHMFLLFGCIVKWLPLIIVALSDFKQHERIYMEQIWLQFSDNLKQIGKGSRKHILVPDIRFDSKKVSHKVIGNESCCYAGKSRYELSKCCLPGESLQLCVSAKLLKPFIISYFLSLLISHCWYKEVEKIEEEECVPGAANNDIKPCSRSRRRTARSRCKNLHLKWLLNTRYFLLFLNCWHKVLSNETCSHGPFYYKSTNCRKREGWNQKVGSLPPLSHQANLKYFCTWTGAWTHHSISHEIKTLLVYAEKPFFFRVLLYQLKGLLTILEIKNII